MLIIDVLIQDKRVFSFIAKAEEGVRHDCFVFLSDKLAEQITLTVGEAFDLAYKVVGSLLTCCFSLSLSE